MAIVVRLKGFHVFRDRCGKTRCYHRATRTAIDLDKAPVGSAGFLAACDKISALAKARADKAAAIAMRAGTLGALIAEYRESDEFRSKAPTTRYNYQGYFDYLQPIANTPLAKINRALVFRIRDDAAKRGWAFNGRQGRCRPHALRAPPYRCGDLARERSGRTHDCRRARAADDRDGPPLRKGCRPHPQNARRREAVRRGTGAEEAEQIVSIFGKLIESLPFFWKNIQ
jgi:hypothetical protein